MKLVKSRKENLPQIIQMIKDAQDLLASQNIDQWQNGYPTKSILLKDIQDLQSYILLNTKGLPLATAMFSTKREPTYSKIDGGWMTPNQTQYGVIHRMAVSKNYRRKGIAKYIFNACETMLKTSQIKSMRIDTHEQNHGMRTLLKTLNYNYCGVIYLENGDKRLAYEKLIQ
jgi:GNAT superfamily N-acetyltransferase